MNVLDYAKSVVPAEHHASLEKSLKASRKTFWPGCAIVIASAVAFAWFPVLFMKEEDNEYPKWAKLWRNNKGPNGDRHNWRLVDMHDPVTGKTFPMGVFDPADAPFDVGAINGGGRLCNYYCRGSKMGVRWKLPRMVWHAWRNPGRGYEMDKGAWVGNCTKRPDPEGPPEWDIEVFGDFEAGEGNREGVYVLRMGEHWEVLITRKWAGRWWQGTFGYEIHNVAADYNPLQTSEARANVAHAYGPCKGSAKDGEKAAV